MDGSTVVIPAAAPPGGLAREDALFRIVYYGEALRAMTEHVSDTLIAGPCVPMIEMLDEAFDRMSETRDSFGPEEFTLFVMSKMLGLCDDVDEARQFQVGAAQYILKSADALPDAYRPVIDDARRMLQRAEPLAVTSAPPSPAPGSPALQADAGSPEPGTHDELPGAAQTERQDATPIPAPVPPAAALQPQAHAPEPCLRAPDPQPRVANVRTAPAPAHARGAPLPEPLSPGTRGATAPAMAAPRTAQAVSAAAPRTVAPAPTAKATPAPDAAQRPRIHFGAGQAKRRSFNTLERMIGIGLLVLFAAFWSMVVTGNFDLSSLESGSQTQQPFRMR